MASNKTMEDWFLRGGEKPAQENAPSRPDSPHECDECDDGGRLVPRDWFVTMLRTKTGRQTAKVRVKAYSGEEAMDIAENQAKDEAEWGPWKGVVSTEECGDAMADKAEVAQ